MRALVVYESMFGNTRQIARAIGEGLEPFAQVTVVRVGDVTEDMLINAELLIVGGPTHAHGMSRPATREEAVRQASAPDSDLTLEPQPVDTGVREWIAGMSVAPPTFAAFDTRADAFRWLTGSAATQIAKQLGKRHTAQVAEPGSFLVPDNDIDLSEIDRAREWAAAAGRAALERLSFPAHDTSARR